MANFGNLNADNFLGDTSVAPFIFTLDQAPIEPANTGFTNNKRSDSPLQVEFNKLEAQYQYLKDGHHNFAAIPLFNLSKESHADSYKRYSTQLPGMQSVVALEHVPVLYFSPTLEMGMVTANGPNHRTYLFENQHLLQPGNEDSLMHKVKVKGRQFELCLDPLLSPTKAQLRQELEIERGINYKAYGQTPLYAMTKYTTRIKDCILEIKKKKRERISGTS